MAEKSKEFYDFKKQVEALKKFRGRGTELISVYVTPGYPLSEITGKLRDEYGQASNIKSKSTQKNVQGALEKIMQYLKTFKQAPENGMAVFCGNVSETEGRTDLQLYSVIPPTPMTVQFYRCESQFVLEPLEEMMEDLGAYGLVVMDGKEATVALLKGTQTKVIKRMNSTAHQKVHKGGQCIHEDELLLLADGTVSQIKALTEGAQVSSINLETQKATFSTCKAVFHRNSNLAFELVTKNPRLSVQATSEHLFFVIDEVGITEKSVEELQIGDRLVAVRSIPNYNTEYLPLHAAVPLGTPVLSPEGRQVLLQIRQERMLRQKDVASAIGTDQMSISELERGEANFGEDRLSRIVGFYGLDKNSFYSKHVSRKPLVNMPNHLSEGLAQILGYFTGDGTYDGNRLIFYEPDAETVAHYKSMLENVFGVSCTTRPVAKKGYLELRAYNKYLVEVLQREFPETREKRTPKKIMQSPNAVAAAFARGLFDAEGSASSNRVSIAMANKDAITALHAILLRLGIISSFGPKKAQYQQQYYLEINDSTSLQAFARSVGFSNPKKQRALYRILSKKSSTNYCDQIPLSGRQVYGLAQRIALRPRDFPGLPSFLNGQRNMSREIFARKVLPIFRRRLQEISENPEHPLLTEAAQIVEYLDRIEKGDLIPVKLVKKIQIPANGQFYDLAVPENQNFVVNGFVVHNSAARYDRLHVEGIEYYYKRIGEAMDAFVGVKNFKGVIVGGPGPAKEDFLKMKTYNYQLKILGMVDTGYTDEFGLREVIEKSGEIIAEQEAVKEKKLVDEFMREISRDGLAIYGLNEVKAAVESKQASKLLVSEDLKLYKFTGKCGQCGKEEEQYGSAFKEEQCDCGGKIQKHGDVDLVNELIGRAEEQGIEVHMISHDTAEGAQFFGTFSGLGAFLRYK